MNNANNEAALKGPHGNGTNHPTAAHGVFLAIVGIVFLALAIVFLFFPRSRYSELEKRDLAEFPDISRLSENPAAYTSAVSSWFSDSEPYRDLFMGMSMNIRDALRFSFRSDEDAITFKPAETPVEGGETTGDEPLIDSGNPLADENAKVANAGIIIVGNAPNARAIMAFGGGASSGGGFINTVNEYAREFPNQKVYALIASSSGEFYLPTKAAGKCKSEQPTLNHIKESLSSNVKFVDVRSALAAHTQEDIFLRTDHHWAPLGAYYAAEAFAKTAGVPFKKLDSYDKRVIHGYVGSMYGYSKDMAIKNSPEDFVYYTPKNLDYKTTFIAFKVNKSYQVTSESKPFESSYFKTFNDGSGAAYCTFMGGDQNLVHIKTSTPGNRKLLVIKDSFGNALPGYLFYSFSDIHVVDFRYFNRNIKKYVADNGITDIVFAFNVFNVCNSTSMEKVRRFLTQANGAFAKEDAPTPAANNAPANQKTTTAPESVKTEPKAMEPAAPESKPTENKPVENKAPEMQAPAPTPTPVPAPSPAPSPAPAPAPSPEPQPAE